MPRPFSDIWLHFIKDSKKYNSSHYLAKCRYCFQANQSDPSIPVIEMRGVKEILQKHLDSCGHYKKIDQSSITKKRDNEQKPMTTNSSILTYTGRAMSINEKAVANQLLLEAFIDANIPFSVTENAQFRKWVNYLCPNYKMPCRKTLANTVLDEVYHQVLTNNDELLGREKYGLTLMVDGWNNIRRNHLLVFSAMSCSRSLFLISQENVSRDLQNANFLAAKMLEVIDRENPPNGVKSNYVAIVTDSASAFVAAKKQVQKKHPTLVILPCFVHIWHLLCGQILKLHWFKNSVELAVKLIIWIRRNPKFESHLHQVQLEREGKFVEILLPGQTRWGSYRDAFQRILRLQWYILQSLKEVPQPEDGSFRVPKGIAVLEDSFWQGLQVVTKLLDILTASLRRLESNKTTIADVCSEFIHCFNDLSKDDLYQSFLNPTRGAVRASVLACVEKRWSKLDYKLLLVSYILLPTNRKSLLFLTRPRLAQIACQIFDQIFGQKAATLWQELKIYFSNLFPFDDNTICQFSKSPVEYYSFISEEAPELAKLSIRLLSITPHSAALEQTFSLMGAVHNKGRNRLLDDRVYKITAIKRSRLLSTENSSELAHQTSSQSDMDDFVDHEQAFDEFTNVGVDPEELPAIVQRTLGAEEDEWLECLSDMEIDSSNELQITLKDLTTE